MATTIHMVGNDYFYSSLKLSDIHCIDIIAPDKAHFATEKCWAHLFKASLA